MHARIKMRNYEMAEAEDRRVTPRKFFTTHASAVYDGKIFTVLTLDLSMSGMTVVSDYNLMAGRIIELTFNLPAVNENGVILPVHVKAILMHCMFSSASGGFKLSLKLTQVDEASTNALKQYLE
jgi:PilZ domain